MTEPPRQKQLLPTFAPVGGSVGHAAVERRLRGSNGKPPTPSTIPSLGEEHEALPRIVKFSGGRSSATLVFLLAKGGLLCPDRGDVILFANTSAEHPATYAFARKCKRLLERDFALPFLWFEFCTVEDAVQGHYARRPSYRLVRDVPIEDDPRGYRHRGEVFEEMLSYQRMLPNPHNRSCTAKLKLHPSHALLAEWLGRSAGPAHAGHYSERRLVSADEGLARYRRMRGRATTQEFRRWFAYMNERPPMRPAQRWTDYTRGKVRDPVPSALSAQMWGHDGARHVTLLGLRADEAPRIDRVLARSFFAEGARGSKCSVRNQPPGERPHFPLADWGLDERAVRRYWDAQAFDLQAGDHSGNCVFCFMKGTYALRAAAAADDSAKVPGTPSDIGWWDAMERKYAREVPARSGAGVSRFGFFGLRGPTFADLAASQHDPNARYARGVPACDCTD